MTEALTSPLNYPQGANTAIRRVRVPRAPTVNDKRNFTSGDEWLDTDLQNWWKFVGVFTNSALWILIGGMSAEIDQITAQDATVAIPVLGNVNIVGGTGITTTAAIDTLTINNTGVVSIPADSGTATASSSNISIKGASGSAIQTFGATNHITISTTGGGLAWTEVTSSPVQMVPNQGYIISVGGIVVFILPPTAPVGSIMRIIGYVGGASWEVTQGAGQQISDGASATTFGAGGFMSSTLPTDCVEMICPFVDIRWQVISSNGILNFV